MDVIWTSEEVKIDQKEDVGSSGDRCISCSCVADVIVQINLISEVQNICHWEQRWTKDMHCICHCLICIVLVTVSDR